VQQQQYDFRIMGGRGKGGTAVDQQRSLSYLFI
jgi:hypothetical protein